MTVFRSLHRAEAHQRAELLAVTSYDVSLDLDRGDEEFESVTRVRFEARTDGTTWLDVKPRSLRSVVLDGATVDADAWEGGRLPLECRAGPHELVVEATMGYRHDGEGLHRSVDPADKLAYVYGMSFMDAAPFIFACFDQPDLKAPVTLHVRAPLDWVVVGNSPGERVEPGSWTFRTTPPLSTYMVTLVAGPYHVLTDEHDGIGLGLSARASLASQLEADADELFTLTKQSFDELHRLFGIRYQFGDYHQAFVPEFNAGAMENPGCVTFRDPMIFTSRVTRGVRIQRAATIAHEMAHQWFGNLTTPVWWDDLWLNESFAEYLGARVIADATEFTDAWASNSFSRRQWGLVADRRPSTHPVAGNGAVSAAAALQDFDGISYAKGSAILKQLAHRLGDDAFLGGTVEHFRAHFLGNATMADLIDAWERVSGTELGDFTQQWLGVAGVDLLAYDRPAGVVRRIEPADHPASRTHACSAVIGGDAGWQTVDLTVSDSAPLLAAADSAVLIDPYDDTWAVTHLDDTTAGALCRLVASVTDPGLRAGAWNALLSSLHDGALTPHRVLEVAAAAVESETSDDALALLRSRVDLLESVTGGAAAMALHGPALARVASAEAGSDLRLAAFQLAVATATDPDRLRGWLDGDLPSGIALDLDVRWALLRRLAELGGTDRDQLQQHLATERTAESTVHHVSAVSSLPDAEAKAYAWAHFTGEIDAPNYDLEAAATGLWRPNQRGLTDGYADRYFAEVAETTRIRSGWLLAEAAQNFFPITALGTDTLASALSLADRPGLDPALRRSLIDRADDLRRRLRLLDPAG